MPHLTTLWSNQTRKLCMGFPKEKFRFVLSLWRCSQKWPQIFMQSTVLGTKLSFYTLGVYSMPLSAWEDLFLSLIGEGNAAGDTLVISTGINDQSNHTTFLLSPSCLKVFSRLEVGGAIAKTAEWGTKWWNQELTRRCRLIGNYCVWSERSQAKVARESKWA